MRFDPLIHLPFAKIIININQFQLRLKVWDIWYGNLM